VIDITDEAKMPKPKIEIPVEKLELYDKLIAANPDIERKGKTVPYTSLNGHMFSFLAKDGTMGLRLSKEQREAFIDKYNTRLIEQYGKVMKEFVQVPSDLFEDTKALAECLKMSTEYTSTLKPK
jgi:hypothetical protein